MTKEIAGDLLMLRAIRALPEQWIDDKTRLAVAGAAIVVMHPSYKPMVFNTLQWGWNELDFPSDYREPPNASA